MEVLVNFTVSVLSINGIISSHSYVTDSSKISSQTPIHGGRGTFLASLSAMSLLSVASHHHSYRSHNAMTMHKSEIVSRQTPAPQQQHLLYFEHGTRVTVRDLFGNMPVRVKQRAIITEKQRGNVKDWEALKRDVVALLLSWPGGVSVTLRELTANQKMVIRAPSGISRATFGQKVDTTHVCSILSQTSLIMPNEKSSWVGIGASTPKLEISGTISLIPNATKDIQFLSLGIQPLLSVDGQSILHDEINRLFLNSAFGNEEETEELDEVALNRRAQDGRYKGDGYTQKELKGVRKGVDRWPMFYINIQQKLPSGASREFDIDDILDDKANSLSVILDLLRAVVWEFLTKHHFRLQAARGHQSRKIDEDAKDSPNGKRNKSLQSQDPIAPRPDFPQTENTRQLQNKQSGGGSDPKQREHEQSGRSKLDPLGTNIKLPSFRRSVSRPFDAWSRIKTGTTAAKPSSPKLDVNSESLNTTLTQRPSTAPPIGVAVSPTLIPRSSTPNSVQQRHATPLFSKNRKIVRRPFGEIIGNKDQSVTPEVQPPSNESLARRKDEDDTMTWVNPITKVRSLVNKRTGLTVSESRIQSNKAASQVTAISHGRLTSRPGSKAIDRKGPSPWVSDMLQKWDNPIFQPAEPSIPQVSFEGQGATAQNILHGRHHHCTSSDIDRAFKGVSATSNGRISKYALNNAEVVSQIDKKFILVKLTVSNSDLTAGEMLVIIDQHAVDERIRIEELMKELCTPPNKATASTVPESCILTMPLDKPLTFEILFKEVRLLQAQKQHFANWGIIYDLPQTGTTPATVKATQRLTVCSLPPGILERSKASPHLLIDLIRTEAHKPFNPATPVSTTPSNADIDVTYGWLHRIHNCPQGIIDMLNSRACRSAIMFNDELSREQCEVLVRRLAGCVFPFQCAHGRPSLVPLVDLGGLSRHERDVNGWDGDAGGENFGATFKRWKKGHKGKS
jgi:DNA mismatch repair protein MLH3